MKVKVLSAPETAFVLRRALGALRAWDDALADMRRGRADCYGYVLKPLGRSHDGRCRRPIYALQAIKEFIVAVRAAEPISEEAIKIQVQEVEIDPDDCRSWLVRPIAPAVH